MDKRTNEFSKEYHRVCNGKQTAQAQKDLFEPSCKPSAAKCYLNNNNNNNNNV